LLPSGAIGTILAAVNMSHYITNSVELRAFIGTGNSDIYINLRKYYPKLRFWTNLERNAINNFNWRITCIQLWTPLFYIKVKLRLPYNKKGFGFLVRAVSLSEKTAASIFRAEEPLGSDYGLASFPNPQGHKTQLSPP
jgi:hypothetical protein